MNNEIIVLVGKSCAGKDTIARKLEKECGYNFVVSTTSRPIRPGESERNPYYFVSNDEFNNKINNDELIEYRSYQTSVNNIPATWYYGVEYKEIDDTKKYVVVLDIIGLKEFRKKFGNKVVAFFLWADDDIRKERCIKRGDYDESEWNRRKLDDEKVFSDEVIDKNIDFKITDENNDYIVKEIIELV
jgi:guanylate kinase